MNELILAIALLAGIAFDDHVSCTVQGYVYRMAKADVVDFTRADSCTGVRITSDDRQLVMYSPKIWVRVLIPADYGHRRFQYRWGSDLAHLGAETVEIKWGRTGKG